MKYKIYDLVSGQSTLNNTLNVWLSDWTINIIVEELSY